MRARGRDARRKRSNRNCGAFCLDSTVRAVRHQSPACPPYARVPCARALGRGPCVLCICELAVLGRGRPRRLRRPHDAAGRVRGTRLLLGVGARGRRQLAVVLLLQRHDARLPGRVVVAFRRGPEPGPVPHAAVARSVWRRHRDGARGRDVRVGHGAVREDLRLLAHALGGAARVLPPPRGDGRAAQPALRLFLHRRALRLRGHAARHQRGAVQQHAGGAPDVQRPRIQGARRARGDPPAGARGARSRALPPAGTGVLAARLTLPPRRRTNTWS